MHKPLLPKIKAAVSTNSSEMEQKSINPLLLQAEWRYSELPIDRSGGSAVKCLQKKDKISHQNQNVNAIITKKKDNAI